MFKEIFGTLMMIFFFFNAIYFVVFPDEVNSITMNTVLVVGANLILTGGVLGITALSVGLDSESISIIVGGVGISLLLFSIPIGITVGTTYYGFNVGLGLVSNIANKFGSDMLGYPSLIVNTMGLVALISGLMIVAGND